MRLKKPKTKTFYELQKSIRKDWNGINPATKIMDKKHYSRKEKYRTDYLNDTYDYDYEEDYEDLSDEELS